MLTRRSLLKYTLAGGGAMLLAGARQSPPTVPFLDPLPLPPPVDETPAFPDLDPAAARFVDPTGARTAHFFQIVAEERTAQFHSQLPPTVLWGYRDLNVPPGQFPFAVGPTFKVHLAQDRFSGNIVRFLNRLPAGHRGFGVPRITTHLHGGHHPSRSDGFPDDLVVNGALLKRVIEPGAQFDYTFPLLDPGSISLTGDFTERPSTLWYHDHLLDFTAQNVYRGLAGFFLVYEDPKLMPDTARDTGDETNAAGAPHALRLPSGDCDVPLVLQDRTFNPDGALFYDPFQQGGFLGDRFTVNGRIQPFFRVQRRKYRFRILNGSNARFYQLFLTNSGGHTRPMTQIATEGGLLSAPLRDLESVLLACAERVEVVIDFSQFSDNELYLENRLAQDDGRGPRGTFESPEILPAGARLLKFILEEPVPDPSLVPDVLRPFDPITPGERASATLRVFEFNRSHGAWTVNGQLVDLTRALATAGLNGPEIFRLRNSSGGWWHPVHVHSEFGRVLSRNGVSPSPVPAERDGIARKDTVILGPGSEVDVFFRFRDYAGPFVFHCHNIEHEDGAMMARLDIAASAGQNSL